MTADEVRAILRAKLQYCRRVRDGLFEKARRTGMINDWEAYEHARGMVDGLEAAASVLGLGTLP